MNHYQQNIVIDLEFTIVDPKNRMRRMKHEIIQIGAVRVNAEGEILDSFLAYVKPECARYVSRKVSRLTGIADRALSDADALEKVLQDFRAWVGGEKTRFVAWSDTDLRQLRNETDAKGISFPEGEERWLDLQKIYPRLMKISKGKLMKLSVAADWCGIKVEESNLHGALYDAQLTAELLSSLMTKEYLEQQDCYKSVMSKEKSRMTTMNVGEKFSALMELKQKLEMVTA